MLEDLLMSGGKTSKLVITVSFQSSFYALQSCTAKPLFSDSVPSYKNIKGHDFRRSQQKYINIVYCFIHFGCISYSGSWTIACELFFFFPQQPL